MELGSRSSSRHGREESRFQCEIQRLHASRHQRRTAVFHQERQNRSRRNSQRLSTSAFEVVASKDRKEVIARAKNETLSGALSSASLPRVSGSALCDSSFSCHCKAGRNNHRRVRWHLKALFPYRPLRWFQSLAHFPF